MEDAGRAYEDAADVAMPQANREWGYGTLVPCRLGGLDPLRYHDDMQLAFESVSLAFENAG